MTGDTRVSQCECMNGFKWKKMAWVELLRLLCSSIRLNKKWRKLVGHTFWGLLSAGPKCGLPYVSNLLYNSTVYVRITKVSPLSGPRWPRSKRKFTNLWTAISCHQERTWKQPGYLRYSMPVLHKIFFTLALQTGGTINEPSGLRPLWTRRATISVNCAVAMPSTVQDI